MRSDVKRQNSRDRDAGAGSFDTSEVEVPKQTDTIFNGDLNFCVTHGIDTCLYYMLRKLDGPRQVKAQVDPTGTGANFVLITLTTNGDSVRLTYVTTRFFSSRSSTPVFVLNWVRAQFADGPTVCDHDRRGLSVVRRNLIEGWMCEMCSEIQARLICRQH